MNNNGLELMEKVNEKNIESIIKFATNNFSISIDGSTQLHNLRKLNLFLKGNNIYLNDLESDILLNKCSMLNVMLSKSMPIIKRDNITIDENIESLVRTYELYNFQNDTNIEEDINNAYSRFNKNNLDLLKLYFLEIKNYKLLSAEEEIELSRKIKLGDEEAMQKLVTHNLRLVVYFAKAYTNPFTENPNFHIEDLIQAGNEGLLKAATCYDGNKGYRFSTYASWWIKQSISRYMADAGRTIRIPVHMVEDIRKISKTENILKSELNRIPSTEEISKVCGISERKIEYIKNHSADIVSLDMPVGESEDSDMLLGDIISSDDDLVENSIEHIELQGFINAFLNSSRLNEREKLVLSYRNGLYNGKCYTLNEIGEILGVTRERVRQIEKTALRKIRRDPFIKAYDPNNIDYEIPSYVMNKNQKSSDKELELKRYRNQERLNEYFNSQQKERKLMLK